MNMWPKVAECAAHGENQQNVFANCSQPILIGILVYVNVVKFVLIINTR